MNKDETHAFSYADLKMRDNGAVREHGSVYFQFCITRTVFMLVCVRMSLVFSSILYGSVLCALLLCLDKIIYVDTVQ